jgi:hypothetical protein
MYSKSFYIDTPFWNNAFSFNKRPNKKLYVPSLIKTNNVNDIKFWDQIVFEDYDFKWNLQSCTWLKNFYEINLEQIQGRFPSSREWQKKIYLFDNHNHAYFFWHKARFDWIISNNSTLYHIDEHTDLRDPWIYLEQEELKDLKRIFEYTNYVDVWNYIKPAIHDWLIKEMFQIRSESELDEVNNKLNSWTVILNELKDPLNTVKIIKQSSRDSSLYLEWQPSTILNLDLDFFQPKLDYIDYKLKKEIVQKLIKKASLITVATSPFFIDQDLALKVFRDLFNIKT